LLKKLEYGVYDVIKYKYIKNNPNYEIGVIAVIHIFDSDLKWNPHIHDLVTKGAIDKEVNCWKTVNYISYPHLKNHAKSIIRYNK
jgi:hypothetical protein